MNFSKNEMELKMQNPTHTQSHKHGDKTQMLKNFLPTKYTVQNMPSFFFRELQLIIVQFYI